MLGAGAGSGGAKCAQVPDPWEGTTPQGREVFRKILFRITHLAEMNTPSSEIAAEVQARLSALPEMRPEFLKIFARLFHQQALPPGEPSDRDLAILLVLRMRLEQAYVQKSAEPGQKGLPIGP